MFFCWFRMFRIFRFVAEQIALVTKIQRCSQLIGFKCFKNYHFAIIRDNCAHICRFVNVADFQSIAGANHTNSYDCLSKG